MLKYLVFGLVTICVRSQDSGYCSIPYECESTCYRTVTYQGWCLFGPCYKTRLEPYTCTETCYKRECCQGYTGAYCLTPLCYGSTTCPNGGECLNPDECNCLPGYYGKKCKACGVLPHVTNGQFKAEGDVDIIAKLECAAGYLQQPNQSPQFQITCDKNGEWTPKDIPFTCEIRDCGNPTQSVVDGQFVIISGTKFGNQALLRCDLGFRATGGEQFIQCGADGAWSVTTATCIPGDQCDTDWLHFNNKCYRPVKQLKTWDEALSECEGLGGTLAALQTQEQFAFLTFELRTTVSFTRYWIGLRNTAEDNNVYTWASDGSVLSGYNPWYPGEPNGINEACVELKNFQGVFNFNDQVCSKKYFYVCEETLS